MSVLIENKLANVFSAKGIDSDKCTLCYAVSNEETGQPSLSYPSLFISNDVNLNLMFVYCLKIFLESIFSLWSWISD